MLNIYKSCLRRCAIHVALLSFLFSSIAAYAADGSVASTDTDAPIPETPPTELVDGDASLELAPLADGLCAANTGLGLGSGAKRNPCVVLDNGTVGCFHDDLKIELIQYSDGALVEDAVGVTNGSFGDQGDFCFYNTAGALYCGTRGVALLAPDIESGVVSVGRLGINGDYCAIANNTFVCGSPGAEPTEVLAPNQAIKSLGCYKEACCVVLADGSLSCSTGTQDLLSNQGNVTFFAGGDNNKCAVYDDGKAICDGANWNGQLGIDGYGNQNQENPTPAFEAGMVATACGQHSACWLSEEGVVWCSGAGSNEAGSGGGQRYPTMIADENGETIDNAVSITSGREFSCAALDTGELTCWGFGRDTAQIIDLNGVGVQMPDYCRK